MSPASEDGWMDEIFVRVCEGYEKLLSLSIGRTVSRKRHVLHVWQLSLRLPLSMTWVWQCFAEKHRHCRRTLGIISVVLGFDIETCFRFLSVHSLFLYQVACIMSKKTVKTSTQVGSEDFKLFLRRCM